MTIKADKWIIQQCTPPQYRLVSYGDDNGKLLRPPYSEKEIQAIANWCHERGHERLGSHAYAHPLTAEEQEGWQPMIEPFYDQPVRYVYKDTGLAVVRHVDDDDVPTNMRRVISFGTSSYGYDVRLKADPEQIKIFTNVFEPEINPKKMKPTNFATPEIREDEEGAKYVLVPPNSYIQGPTMEYFRIPRDVLVVVVGKSTTARAGLICNVTPMEPEWEGELVVEIANATNSPVRVYLEEGCCQLLWYKSDTVCQTSYKDKAGKYMHQTGLTLAKV